MNRRHSPALLIGLVAILLTVVSGAPAQAQAPGAQSKIDLYTTNALQTATQPTLRVIVRVTPAGFDRLKSTIRQMMSAAGVPCSPLAHEILGAVTAQLALADIQRLALDPDVLRISSDALVRSSQAAALPAIDVEYVALHQQRDAIVAQAAAARTQTNQSYQAQLDAANAAAAAADAQYAATLVSQNDTLVQLQQAVVAIQDTATGTAAVAAAGTFRDVERARINAWFAPFQTDYDAKVAYAYATYVASAQAAYDAAKAEGKDLTKYAATLATAKVKADIYLYPYKRTYESRKGIRDDQLTPATEGYKKVTEAAAQNPGAVAAAKVVLNTELMRIQVWFAAAQTAWDDQVNYAYVKYIDAIQAKYDVARAQNKDTTSLKTQLDAAKATANTYLAPYKATYEAQKKTRDQQNSAANTVFSTAKSTAVASLKAAQDAVSGQVSLIAATTRARSDAANTLPGILKHINEAWVKALETLDHTTKDQLNAVDDLLEANRKAFIAQIKADSASLKAIARTVGDRAPEDVQAVAKKMSDASTKFQEQISRTPYIRDNKLLASLGLTRSTLTGYEVGVAVVDSGITPDGNISVDAAFDFTMGTIDPHRPDEFGHGTHVAGLIASSGENALDGTYRGVAPGVRLIDLKVLDAQGQGHTSDVVLALEFAVAMRDQLGIDVINLSLGHPIYEPAATDPLVQAVEAAVRAGIVVVVSAGNMGRDLVTHEVGYAGLTSPGNAPSALTVGSLDTKGTASLADDTVAPYSSRGPTWYDGLAKPDLVAPGHKLVSDAALGAPSTPSSSAASSWGRTRTTRI